MRARSAMRVCALLGFVLASVCAHADEHWLAAWGAAPLRSPIVPNIQLVHPPRNRALRNQTVREVVTVGAGGTQVRLHLDNRYGESAVAIGHLTLARMSAGDAIDTASLVQVTLHGKGKWSLPAAGSIDTDAVAFNTHTGDRVAVSVYVPQAAEPASWHTDARYAQSVSAEGDHAEEAVLPGAIKTPGYDWLTRVDVAPGGGASAIVTLGDSITNGFRASAGLSYPEQLAARLRQAGCDSPVINMGIDGNQVAAGHGNFGQGDSMIERFAHDVAPVPGARYLVLLGGINDIGEPTMAAKAANQPTPDGQALASPVIAGLKRLAQDARQLGLRVYGATLPPFGGTERAFTAQGEAARQAINAWIRHGAPYDAIIDFDAALRDAAQPERMQARFDSGDHIHPNDAGYGEMAKTIPLALFACKAATASVDIRPSLPPATRAGALARVPTVPFQALGARR